MKTDRTGPPVMAAMYRGSAESLVASIAIQLNAGPNAFLGEPAGYYRNITTEERTFRSIASVLRERNQ
jgi:hypothetical protein